MCCVFTVGSTRESTCRRNKRGPDAGAFFAMRHRQPCQWRVVRCDFLEAVDAGNREDTGLLVDFELVAFARLDFFAVRKPDYEHGAPLDRWVVGSDHAFVGGRLRVPSLDPWGL